MAWLRVDDGMPEHRKVLALPRKDRWTWLELLCYVARQNNGGHVPAGVCDVLRWVTPAFLQRCAEAGLLDPAPAPKAVPGEPPTRYVVHDWSVYNAATIAEKVSSILTKNPDATANEIHREIGGKREIVLHEVASQRGSPVPKPVPREPDDRFPGTAQSGSPSRARANPSPTPKEPPSSSSTKDADHDDAETEARLRTAGWSDGRIAIIAGRQHLALAARWLEAAEQDPTVENPGAYAYAMTDGGTEPPASRERQSTLAPGATGTRSTAPPLPDRAPEPDLERIAPPAEFLALANGQPSDTHTKKRRAEPALEPVLPKSRARTSRPEGDER